MEWQNEKRGRENLIQEVVYPSLMKSTKLSRFRCASFESIVSGVGDEIDANMFAGLQRQNDQHTLRADTASALHSVHSLN